MKHSGSHLYIYDKQKNKIVSTAYTGPKLNYPTYVCNILLDTVTMDISYTYTYPKLMMDKILSSSNSMHPDFMIQHRICHILTYLSSI